MPDYILSETMCPVRESIFALSKPSYSWFALSKPRVTCTRMISKVMEKHRKSSFRSCAIKHGGGSVRVMNNCHWNWVNSVY